MRFSVTQTNDSVSMACTQNVYSSSSPRIVFVRGNTARETEQLQGCRACRCKIGKLGRSVQIMMAPQLLLAVICFAGPATHRTRN